mmetsp:Transcript_45840/g.81920  ORF Transcript_45840/g.81920 Transcript_45840/m.81920 type:complete len:166 (+) Transcript_45840:2109-2606(+)
MNSSQSDREKVDRQRNGGARHSSGGHLAHNAQVLRNRPVRSNSGAPPAPAPVTAYDSSTLDDPPAAHSMEPLPTDQTLGHPEHKHRRRLELNTLNPVENGTLFFRQMLPFLLSSVFTGGMLDVINLLRILTNRDQVGLYDWLLDLRVVKRSTLPAQQQALSKKKL